MNKLRTLLAAAGLGFFIDTAMAQEDTANEEPTREYTINDFVRVNDNNFQEEVIEESYRRTVVVLYDSSCPSGDTAKKLAKNLQDTLLIVMKSHDSKAKFARFDRCNLGIDTEQKFGEFEKTYGPGSASLATVFYSHGKEFFRKEDSFIDRNSYFDRWVLGFSRRLE